MNDIGGMFKAIGSLMIAAVGLFVLGWIVALVGLALLAGGFAVGFISIYAVKSGKALVRERSASRALGHSVIAAAGLTFGMLLGSAALTFTNWWIAQQHGFFWFDHWDESPIWGIWSVADNWLIDWICEDSIWFFLKLVPICYLANRIFVARHPRQQRWNDAPAGQWTWLRNWLGVVPPLFAMLVFSVVVHFEELRALLTQPSSEVVLTIAVRTLDNLSQPIRLALLVYTDPSQFNVWLSAELSEAGTNFFKLAKLYPTGFALFGVSMAARALVS